MAKPSPRLDRDIFFNGAKIIKRELTPHKKILFWLSVFGLLNAVTLAFAPLISGKILDAIIAISQHPTATLSSAISLILIWMALQIVSNIISWWAGFEDDKLATNLAAEYTAMAMGRLFEMPLAFHTTQQQGDITDRINRAANWLDSIVDNVLLSLLPNFLSIGVALIITLFINPQLTLVLIVAIIIYSAILWNAVPQISGLQKRMNKAYNQAYGEAGDAMGNIREIKQAATEDREKKEIRKNFVSKAAAFWVDLNTIWARLNFFQKTVVSLTQVAIFGLSLFFVRDGMLTPGGLVAFNGYAAMMLGPFIQLGQQWRTVQDGLVALVRADKIITLPTENYAPHGSVAPEKIQGDVVFDHVRFGYKGNRETLTDISFHVKPGQKIALVGESGVGKTTIIDLLSAFYFPQKGAIRIDGIDIKKINLKAYRSRIGVVPQEPSLFNDTIENNIRYGNPGKTTQEFLAACEKAHARSFIEKFPKKYKSIVGWRGVKLSIGQKQRIALARAFLRNPDILVLDEPTSALDAHSEKLIKESLDELMKGRTTFIIAHRLSTVREVDIILVLKDGKIVEQGTHQELLQLPKGIYRSLSELQTGLVS